MQENIGVEISGMKTLEKKLISLSKEIGITKAGGMMTSALRAGAAVYQQDMLQNVTVSNVVRKVRTSKGAIVEIRPGFLKSRIKIRASTNRRGQASRKFGRDVVSLVRVGVFRVPYIWFYEAGTEDTDPNPIIRNAFNQTPKAINATKRALIKRIRSAQRRISKQKNL